MSGSANDAAPGISRTSIWVAAGRAIGAREPDASARNPDHLAETLLGDPSQLPVKHPVVDALRLSYDEAMRDFEVVSHVRAMTVRTRFIDEALARAVAGGVTQVVVLGAGFDSHAYRCQELLSQVRVFEVDRAATQNLKKQRVNAVLGSPPANLRYVAIDFQHDDLGTVLAAQGCNRAQPTFFIMEGVTMYLPEEALRGTLRFVAGHAAGSGIVFDFVYRPMIDMIARIDLANVSGAARPFVERFQNLIKDEPWLFGFPLDGEREYLAGLGLERREVLAIGGEESLKRYLTKSDGTLVGAETIAEGMARMIAQARAAAPSSLEAQEMSPERMRERQRTMMYQVAEAIVARQE